MNKVKILKPEDKYFPKRLLAIKDYPKTLYVVGNEKILNNQSIAIVGSRNASEYGLENAKRFSYNISNIGITIVSGLAIGIDSKAHEFSYKNKGKTVAVIASGFNNIYPKQNIELFNNIIKEGGCIISEYPPETEVDMSKFPKRNRLIAGISLGVLVIEAKFRSGSGITARYAMEQGKRVFCIPNRIYEKNGIGTNNLIKKYAELITCEQDILNELNIKSKIDEKKYITQEVKLKSKKDKTNIKKTKKDNIINKYIPEEYKEIYNLIKNNINNANAISNKTKLDISVVNQKLTMMEIEDLIEPANVNNYIIKK